jgi:hypothetical protein
LREREREREIGRSITNPPTSQIWKNINSPDCELHPKVQFFGFSNDPLLIGPSTVKFLKEKKKSLKLLVIYFWVH